MVPELLAYLEIFSGVPLNTHVSVNVVFIFTLTCVFNLYNLQIIKVDKLATGVENF